VAEDMASTDSMFSHPRVSKVEADFPVNSSSSAGNERAFRCEPTIKVTWESEVPGEPTTFFVFTSWLHVRLVKDEADTTLWQISEVREELKDPSLKGRALATEACTFGSIKAMFRTRRACEVAPRSTPECLIDAFEWAMMRKRSSEYNSCLSDMFLFEFTAEDAELIGLPPDEPWWGKTEDASATGNLFADGSVSTIFCDLSIVEGPWPTDGGFMYRLEPDIKITVEDGGGGRTIYWVHSSWLDAEIVPDPYSPEQWVFHSMAESVKSPYAVAGSPSTFGRVKAMWR
jgi:hypothetical protein